MKGHYYKPHCKCPGFQKKKCKCGAKWAYILDLGKKKDGSRNQKKKSGFDTKDDAEASAAIMLELFKSGQLPEQIEAVKEKELILCKFEELKEKWLAHYSKHGKPKKDGTIRIRKNESDNLTEILGEMIARDITEEDYQNALIKLKEGDPEKGKEPLSHNTLKGINTTGGMIFEYGLKQRAVEIDPTVGAYVPRDAQTVEDLENNIELPKYLERDELVIFLDTARIHGLELDYEMFSTLSYTGMRVGEMCALKETDVKKDIHQIKITKTLYNPNNNYRLWKLNTPKTKSSIRDIDVEIEIIDILSSLIMINQIEKVHKKDSYLDHGFVFAKRGEFAGCPQVVKMVENRMKRLLKIAGLNQDLTPHSLRHTHTSLLAEAGVGLEQIMQRLGHSDDKVTKQVYLHITKPRKKEASQKFAELLRKPPENEPNVTQMLPQDDPPELIH